MEDEEFHANMYGHAYTVKKEDEKDSEIKELKATIKKLIWKLQTNTLRNIFVVALPPQNTDTALSRMFVAPESPPRRPPPQTKIFT